VTTTTNNYTWIGKDIKRREDPDLLTGRAEYTNDVKLPGMLHAAFVRSEAVLVLGGAAVLAVFLGWLLSMMLVALLRHVFDPPPDHLAIPWMFLTELGGAALLGGLVAALLASRGLRRLPLGSILREQ